MFMAIARNIINKTEVSKIECKTIQYTEWSCIPTLVEIDSIG